MCRVHHMKFWADWLTSWNQDCPEKYLQSQICRWHHPNGRKWRTEELLTKVKEESEKIGLKINIQKTKIMASRPMISWQIDGEKVEMVAYFIFLGSKITADGNCSHEINNHVWMWELDHKENWAPKNWCFRIVVLEKSLESPLDIREIKPVNPKGNHWKDWCWSSNTLATLWEEPTHWKRCWCWEDWRQKEKHVAEDEMVI